MNQCEEKKLNAANLSQEVLVLHACGEVQRREEEFQLRLVQTGLICSVRMSAWQQLYQLLQYKGQRSRVLNKMLCQKDCLMRSNVLKVR
jgi:hypothetical protein